MRFSLAGGLTGTPASVTIDVIDLTDPGNVLATIPNGSITQVGASATYLVDLEAVGGIAWPTPGDPAPRDYLLRWSDDAGNVVERIERIGSMVGNLPVWSVVERVTVFYPSVPIPERGISQTLVNNGAVSYLQFDVSRAQDFDNPEFTFFHVFVYAANGRVQSVTPSMTPPNP